jgi:hypothetical protein
MELNTAVKCFMIQAPSWYLIFQLGFKFENWHSGLCYKTLFRKNVYLKYNAQLQAFSY